ncbi:MAG: glycerophosphodiester phosphodiesterase family protein [Bacteroidales bacterium]|nr:hypothetical protein [Bacteroidales bacterium]
MSFFKIHIKLINSILIILAILISAVIILYSIFISEDTKFAFTNDDHVVLFAHRGQISYAPENTYESVLLAQNQGFEAVEIDIRHTKDKELVLFHDETMKRMLGEDKKLEDEIFSNIEKKNIIWKKRITTSKVVKLEKIFQDFPNLYFYLDIKTPTNENIDKLVSLIRKYNMENKVIVSHANFFKQIRFKLKYSSIANALEGFNSGHEKWIRFIPHKLRPDFYSSFIYETDKKQVSKLKEKGLLNRKIVYGVDKNNIDQAISDFELKYLIIDIDSIPSIIK